MRSMKQYWRYKVTWGTDSMADVFISYAKPQQPEAKQLADQLVGAGYSVWWDRHVDIGDEWHPEIERELRYARVAIVIWSKDAQDSSFVRWEAQQALRERKLIQLRINHFHQDSVPPPFCNEQVGVFDDVSALLSTLRARLKTPQAGSTYAWEYQWEDPLNAVSERVVEPQLQHRIVAELLRIASTGASSALIHVRGELGIGKTTLCGLLLNELRQQADANVLRLGNRANALGTCAVLEAGDLESAEEFAGRINRAIDQQRYVIALARPLTLQVASMWIRKSPDASVEMRPFEPGLPLFHDCLSTLCNRMGLQTQSEKEKLGALAGQLPDFMKTPFYFSEIIAAIQAGTAAVVSNPTPLQMFRFSLERRIGSHAFQDLIHCALGDKLPEDIDNIAGIIDHRGFCHDGYRNVALAAAAIDEIIQFSDLVRLRNSREAVRMALDHIKTLWRTKRKIPDTPLLAELDTFVKSDLRGTNIKYAIYWQALVAATLRELGLEKPADALRHRCMDLINNRNNRNPRERHAETIWWDVSDALTMIGDPRLRSARRQSYNPNSGYFLYLPETRVAVGCSHTPSRTDRAKPVLPYAPTSLNIGPLWVAKFLVTNELFREFWTEYEADNRPFLKATGRQWGGLDPTLMTQIEAAFDVTARRCFWKEMKEDKEIVSGIGAMNVVEVARLRALRNGRVALWDPTLGGDRFSSDGCPVVGVTWWEAMAFCRWWTIRKLDDNGFPEGAFASLLTDWEWEAIRRLYYDPRDHFDTEVAPVDRYPCHLRSAQRQTSSGRVNSPMRPLHVGLAPSPVAGGPYDMVGNVWEWTRSRVFGRIVNCNSPDPDFGNTGWDDVDVEAERLPKHPSRDVVDQDNDLAYRAVRGASFFSSDQQAAWHPAYRLCDPPFSSYFDLGFRIAVYPSGEFS